MRRLSFLLVALVVSAFAVGCASAPPPIAPDPPRPWNDNGGPIAVAATPDPSALRSEAERERERINALLDVVERRDLKEARPLALREMKESARQLDKIEARINEIDRTLMGPDRENELELVSDELRRLQTRVALMEDALR